MELDQLGARLRAAPGLRPVPPDQDHAFYLHDLASTAECAFGEQADFPVTEMTADQETGWSQRLGGYWARHTAIGEYADSSVDRYWITAPSPAGDDVVAGTVAVDRWTSGRTDAKLYSLYIQPGFRGRGLAARVLDQVYHAALASGLAGIRLDTSWIRQNALGFYLAHGMWVQGWTHNICFFRSRFLPPYEIARLDPHLDPHLDHCGPDSLTLSVDLGEGMRALLVASNGGDTLGWTETEFYARLLETNQYTLLLRSQATLAVACAVRGWPLVRSAQHWADRCLSCDVGGPEGLADKISLFEAAAEDDGWELRTPHIPGVPWE
jgi:GNAT superfamily N-acetyltransferase